MNTIPPAPQCISSFRIVPGRGTDGPSKPAEIVELSSRRRIPPPAHPGQVEAVQPGWAPKLRFILVASDDEYLWSLLRASLEGSEFIACSCARPQDASCIVRDRKVDLLIADVPSLTSPQFRLASDVSTFAPGLPVMAISAFTKNDRAAQLLEHCGWPSISAPFRPHELLDAIEKLLATQPSTRLQQRETASHGWRSLHPWLA